MILRLTAHLVPRRSQQGLVLRHVAHPPLCRVRTSRSTTNHDVSLLACRCFASSRTTDEVMEDLQELYATAKDEFEMAAEETEKKTVYASEDRDAAKEALKLLKDAYEKSLKLSSPQVAEEIRGRVSQRIRELDNANTALEESAMED